MNILRKLLPVGLMLLLLLPPAFAQNADKYQTNGTTLLAYPLNPVTLDSGTYRIQNVNVVRDNLTGADLLIIRFTAQVPNHTTYNISGPLPSGALTIAPDLSSATLNTVINTDAGQPFYNPYIGPISGLAINLTWTADMLGKMIDTWNFSYQNGSYYYHETNHMTGPHAECTVSGVIGENQLDAIYGFIDQNRISTIAREIVH